LPLTVGLAEVTTEAGAEEATDERVLMALETGAELVDSAGAEEVTGADAEVTGAGAEEVTGAGAEVAGGVDLVADARRSGQTFGSSARVVEISAGVQLARTQGVALVVMRPWLAVVQMQA